MLTNAPPLLFHWDELMGEGVVGRCGPRLITRAGSTSLKSYVISYDLPLQTWRAIWSERIFNIKVSFRAKDPISWLHTWTVCMHTKVECAKFHIRIYENKLFMKVWINKHKLLTWCENVCSTTETCSVFGIKLQSTKTFFHEFEHLWFKAEWWNEPHFTASRSAPSYIQTTSSLCLCGKHF